MTRNLVLPLIGLVALLIAAAPLSAQSVRGELRAEERDVPIPDARLYLVSAEAAIVDSTRTDRTGAFRLNAPAAGTYRLQFQSDGWAGIASDEIVLAANAVTPFTFRVPLVPNAALQQMSDMIGMDERLQTHLPDICGEALRPWEAGVLVGIVRARRSKEPIAGTRVAVATAEHGVTRSTIASDHGIYILCNVPLGTAVAIIAETPDGRVQRTDVEIRAGMVSWYDLLIR